MGKKTAEQILLDLRDKSALLASVAGAAPAAPKPLEPGQGSAPPNLSDAITALVSIGYSEKEATKKAEAAATEVGTDDLEVLVRAAMRA